jgi:hypothetical protein
MNPSFSAAYKLYLTALGHNGRTQEANVIRQRLLALEPDFTIERFMATTPLEREADRALYAEGLRLAGVAERDEDVAHTGADLELHQAS